MLSFFRKKRADVTTPAVATSEKSIADQALFDLLKTADSNVEEIARIQAILTTHGNEVTQHCYEQVLKSIVALPEKNANRLQLLIEACPQPFEIARRTRSKLGMTLLDQTLNVPTTPAHRDDKMAAIILLLNQGMPLTRFAEFTALDFFEQETLVTALSLGLQNHEREAVTTYVALRAELASNPKFREQLTRLDAATAQGNRLPADEERKKAEEESLSAVDVLRQYTRHK